MYAGTPWSVSRLLLPHCYRVSDDGVHWKQVEKLASGNGNIIGGDPEWTSAPQVHLLSHLLILAVAVYA